MIVSTLKNQVMYFIGNVKFFLEKKKFARSAVDEIAAKLQKQTVNNVEGDGCLFDSASLEDCLDTDTAAAFRKDFQADPIQMEIATNRGQLPTCVDS